MSSWTHLITAGDDGKVVFYNLYSDDWSDAKEKQLHFEGRVKCLHIGDEDDIEQDVAYLFCGTNRGEVSERTGQGIPPSLLSHWAPPLLTRLPSPPARCGEARRVRMSGRR